MMMSSKVLMVSINFRWSFPIKKKGKLWVILGETNEFERLPSGSHKGKAKLLCRVINLGFCRLYAQLVIVLMLYGHLVVIYGPWGRHGRLFRSREELRTLWYMSKINLWTWNVAFVKGNNFQLWPQIWNLHLFSGP